MNRYEEAATKLETTIGIADKLELVDEQGIIISNLGRLAAVEIIHNVEAKHQIQALEERSLPKFKQAYKILKGHPHYFYPFTNAEHGSIVAALVGDRKFAAALVIEGMSLALRRSPEPYDQTPPYTHSQYSLAQLAIAANLIPFGNRTPVLAKYARRNLIR